VQADIVTGPTLSRVPRRLGTENRNKVRKPVGVTAVKTERRRYMQDRAVARIT